MTEKKLSENLILHSVFTGDSKLNISNCERRTITVRPTPLDEYMEIKGWSDEEGNTFAQAVFSNSHYRLILN